ncbi:MAG: hypothetical protein WCK35_09795 [Chloroflexota bacterium]
MLVTIAIWLYILAICYIYGCFFLKQVQLRMGIQAELPVFPLVSLSGLVLLTVLASFYSLLFNVGIILNLVFMAGAIAILLKGTIEWPSIFRAKRSTISSILLFLVVLILLENSTHRPVNPDTNIYHAQAIHWIETFPAVPGLGNLHGRLAFNSAWFIANALFSFSFLNLGSFHLVPGVFFLLILLVLWDGLEKTLAKRANYSLAGILKLLFIPLAFYLLGAEVSSPGTDMPASLLIWLVIILWIENLEGVHPFNPFLIVLFTFFALTVKFSSIPIIFLVLLIVYNEVNRKQKGYVLVYLLIGIFILLPFIVRNIILSGYMLYPFPAVDIFNFDWKVPFARADQDRLAILAWARFPRLSPDQVLSMSFLKWFPAWLSDQTINRKGIFFAAIFSVFATIPGWKLKIITNRIFLAWLGAYLGTLFWFFSAPDFRFGYGFLIPTIFLPIAILLHLLIIRIKPANKLMVIIIGVSLLVFLFYTLASSIDVGTLKARAIFPAGYDNVSTEMCKLANGSVFCAKSYNMCSYSDFPCIPNPRPWVQMRGNSFREGFRANQ